MTTPNPTTPPPPRGRTGTRAKRLRTEMLVTLVALLLIPGLLLGNWLWKQVSDSAFRHGVGMQINTAPPPAEFTDDGHTAPAVAPANNDRPDAITVPGSP